MPIVNFVSRQMAEAFTPGNGGFFHLVSISDPDVTPALRQGWKGVLVAKFHDLDRKPGGYPYKLPFGVFPDEERCQHILDFARGCLAREENVLVHCEAGVSRSAAAALALEAMGFELMNRERASCANTLMLALFGKLLGTKLKRPQSRMSEGGILW